jgi:high affinity Mn2+ porin
MGRFVDATTLFNVDPIMYSAANIGTDGARGTQCADLGGGGAETGAFANHISRTYAPDLCWARKLNDKVGIGINVEQAVAKDIGVFLRAMYSDGQTEVEAYLPTDRSIAFGVLARGGRWGRRNDYAGVGFGAGWISKEHADYYRLGGIDGFVGDGKLNEATEWMAEAFYGANLTSSIWLSADYQLIANPGFNADRGPLSVVGGRFHAEF